MHSCQHLLLDIRAARICHSHYLQVELRAQGKDAWDRLHRLAKDLSLPSTSAEACMKDGEPGHFMLSTTSTQAMNDTATRGREMNGREKTSQRLLLQVEELSQGWSEVGTGDASFSETF